jgi:hypothetical protein
LTIIVEKSESGVDNSTHILIYITRYMRSMKHAGKTAGKEENAGVRSQASDRIVSDPM